MYIRKRKSRRRSFLRRYRTPIFFLFCGSICVLGFLLKQSSTRAVRAVPSPATQNLTYELDPQEQIRHSKFERVVYPYSVIPGGVRSRAELESHMASDRVVREHFADFDLRQTRIVKSEEPQSVHVAYRVQDKIFWTSKKVAIAKGETLITDGKSVARTRCGNKVSVLPQEPVSEEEPPLETFEIPVSETPMIANAFPPELELSKLPDLAPTLTKLPEIELPIQSGVQMAAKNRLNPPYEYFPYHTPRRLFRKPPPNVVSDYGTTAGLVIIGIVVIAGVRLARRHFSAST